MALVTVRYWAAARAAAGVAEEQVEAGTLAAALEAVLECHRGSGPRLEQVLAVCAYVVDGAPVGRRDPTLVALDPGAEIEVLPPFAGGSSGAQPTRTRPST